MNLSETVDAAVALYGESRFHRVRFSPTLQEAHWEAAEIITAMYARQRAFAETLANVLGSYSPLWLLGVLGEIPDAYNREPGYSTTHNLRQITITETMIAVITDYVLTQQYPAVESLLAPGLYMRGQRPSYDDEGKRSIAPPCYWEQRPDGTRVDLTRAQYEQRVDECATDLVVRLWHPPVAQANEETQT